MPDPTPPKPPTPPLFTITEPDRLSTEQRGCLLRAARASLLILENELERFRNLDSRYIQAALDSTQAEIDCLEAGMAWIWRQPVA